MKNQELFHVEPTRPSLRANLKAFMHANGILTHRSHRYPVPWIAVLLFEKDKGKHIAVVMGESCRLYDDAGRIAEGAGELYAVRKLAERFSISGCP
jgi:hypothetical protein